MLSFSFLSHVSLVCFLKKWPKIDLLFWAVFFTPEKANERFLPLKPLSNNDQFFISLYKFIYAQQHIL